MVYHGRVRDGTIVLDQASSSRMERRSEWSWSSPESRRLAPAMIRS